MELAGQRVLVIGLGVSGRSAARFCAERGAHVRAVDDRGAAALEDLAELDALAGVTIELEGALPELANFDLVVPSPGVPRERWASAGQRVLGDVELAARFLEVPIVAVTGTNGKSTTVRLIEAMLCASGLRARAAGNVGTPALSLVGEALDVAVLEVSSFQLEAVSELRPQVAVVLNVTPDHLDRHGDLETYAATKARLLARQQPEDRAVLCVDDPIVAAMTSRSRARIVPVSRIRALDQGLCLDGATALWRDRDVCARIALDSLPLAGVHNLENVLAALAAALCAGADREACRRALLAFRPLPHRCQRVPTQDGITWVDDSKATNPGAAIRSLESFGGAIWWIAGGRDKHLDFASLADLAATRVHHALLIGEAAGALERALAGRVKTTWAGTLEKAVEIAARAAQPGDVVLLAPACASFDQFRNFEERGRAFQQAVAALASGPRAEAPT